MNPLLRRREAEWFERSPVELARALLGQTLVHVTDRGMAAGRIVETEAYLGLDDAASHASLYRRGRECLARPAGRVYMYRAYGVHAMFNIVAHPAGQFGAVLVRAIEPVAGIELMRQRRGVVTDSRLGQGPGNLCQALGFTLDEDGRDLISDDRLWIAPSASVELIAVTPRIGITKNADALLRFFDAGSRSVSGSRRYDSIVT